jgi:hypothetical protein
MRIQIISFLLFLSACGSATGSNSQSQTELTIPDGVFSGTWKGSGSISDPDGSNPTTCPDMMFELDQTSQAFAIVSGHFDCGLVSVDVGPAHFVIVNGALVVNGRSYGSITDTQVQADIDVGNARWTFTFTRNGSELTYTDVMTTMGSSMRTDGVFTRQ